jgi:glycerate 2-kinase
MPLRILVAPDKFKGTLTAAEATRAIARGWHRLRPDDALELLPISDGGDGFGETLGALLGGRAQTSQTVDSAQRPCRARWWWEPQSRTAIIESARVIGLAMLPAEKFHPFELDTFGLGALFRAAGAKGAKRILIGIGGSATNDGGFGLARSLGWKFLDRRGRRIERWPELHALAEVGKPPSRPAGRVTVAVDVQNPLLGLRGATRVYGPQKGLRREDFALAEGCLRRLAGVVERKLGRDLRRAAGAGAAGGLGFGLCAFLDAKTEPGFDLFARQAGLLRRLRAADVVVTGEGAVDDSTLMGKGVGQLARLARADRIPCIALAGSIEGTGPVGFFEQVHALTGLVSAARAKARPAFWLERLAGLAAGIWNEAEIAKVARTRLRFASARQARTRRT